MPDPRNNPSAPVSAKDMGDGHKLTVYGPHNAAPVDQYQMDPHNEDGAGPLLETGVVPGGGSGGQHEWIHTHHGEPINQGYAHTAPEAMEAAERSHADMTGDWDPNAELEHLGRRTAAPRKQAWSGWGPGLVEEPHHKVAGWEWDEHLNAHVSTSNPRTFTCTCGTEHPVPSYSNCRCGKIWNSYVIGTGGDRHEASAEKYLAREVPQRKDVIVANRRYAAEQRRSAFDPRAYLAAQHRTALEMEDLRGPFDRGYHLEDEVEDNAPFPSEHHPKAGDATMTSQPSDWYARGKGNKWAPGANGPHQKRLKKRTDA